MCRKTKNKKNKVKRWISKSKTQKKAKKTENVRPAFISGVVWGVGFGGQLFAVTDLPYSVGYPICSIGPVLISTLWSLLFFKEIKGQRNLKYLIVSIITMIAGIVMLGVSV